MRDLGWLVRALVVATVAFREGWGWSMPLFLDGGGGGGATPTAGSVRGLQVSWGGRTGRRPLPSSRRPRRETVTASAAIRPPLSANAGISRVTGIHTSTHTRARAAWESTYIRARTHTQVRCGPRR